jgi:LysM repeat protein
MTLKHTIKTFSLFFILLVIFAGCKAQNRSTNIQTIGGKKFYVHKIEKKQSLYAITKLYNVSLEELYSCNPELREGAKANQEIKVPFAPSTTAAVTASATAIDTNKYLTHKVAKGETMYSLSRRYNVTEKQLLNFNPSLSQGMREGQLVIVGEKKNIRKGKDQKNKAPDYAVREDPSSLLFDSARFSPLSRPKKDLYKLALILPFKLDEMLETDPTMLARTKSEFPDVPGLAVDFYLGFKRAMDSLAATGFSLDLRLFDVDESDSLKLAQFTDNPEFGSYDMVFGPLYANGFNHISQKSAEMRVPIVSPITRQNKILFNNIYVSKTNPSQYTLMESLADYCIDTLMPRNINLVVVVLNDKDRRETQYVSAFRTYFNDRQLKAMKPIGDTLRIVKGINEVKTAYRPGVKNVAVVLSSNQVYITDFTTQLAIFANGKDYTLCGWQNVTEMDNIDQEYLNQLHYTFPHQFNLTNTAAFAPIVKFYQNQQDAGPTEYYFMGFDVAYYYLKNLRDIGPDFIYKLDEYPMETSYMRFKYYRPDNITGFDNRGVFIFLFDNYQLRKTGWK